MGYTQHEKQLIARHINGIKSVCDYGSQNDYTIHSDKPPFISDWYSILGIHYTCIDLAGDNDAIKIDLSHPVDIGKRFDLVVDAGQSEHIVQMDGYTTASFHGGHIHSIYPTKVSNKELGFYNAWLNKHNLLNEGGKMININPKTENWPDHGYSYINQDFYTELAKLSDYKILEIGENAAMNNTENGWNIYSVLLKTGDRFPTFEEFQTLPIFEK